MAAVTVRSFLNGSRKLRTKESGSEYKKSARHSCMLLLAALVWGVAFVAQSDGLNYVGAFTFNTCRFILGGCGSDSVYLFPAWQKRQRMADLV